MLKVQHNTFHEQIKFQSNIFPSAPALPWQESLGESLRDLAEQLQAEELRQLVGKKDTSHRGIGGSGSGKNWRVLKSEPPSRQSCFSTKMVY